MDWNKYRPGETYDWTVGPYTIAYYAGLHELIAYGGPEKRKIFYGSLEETKILAERWLKERCFEIFLNELE